MEQGMTNEQFKKVLKMIITIIEDSESKDEAVEKIKAIGHCDFIMQEYIESSKGRDVRIHIVGDKIVTAMERVNEDDFRANITNTRLQRNSVKWHLRSAES